MTNISSFIKSILENDFFIGLVLAGLITGFLYTLKSIPFKIGSLLKWKFVTVLSVNSTDNIFPWIDKWISENTKYGQKCHRLRVNEIYSRSNNEDETKFGIGLGDHYFFHRKALVRVSRELMEEAKSGSHKLNEKIVISSLSKKAVIDIFDRSLALSKSKEDIDILMNHSHGGFCEVRGVSPRPLDTIYGLEDSIESLIGRIDSFFSSRDWYIERGIPWRLGIFIHGPPGTGKSSIARALATYFASRLYIIHLGNLISDEGLFSCMRDIKQKSFVLIEDIDCSGTQAINNRGHGVANKSHPNKASEEANGIFEISLSALLNSIDGVMAPEGRVLIMTTNNPEKIDPALTREGRVDIEIKLGKIGPDGILRMLRKFFGPENNDSIVFNRLKFCKQAWTPSYAQEIMIKLSNKEQVIEELIKNPK